MDAQEVTLFHPQHPFQPLRCVRKVFGSLLVVVFLLVFALRIHVLSKEVS